MSRLKYSETEKVLLLRSYLESGMDAKTFHVVVELLIPPSAIFASNMALQISQQSNDL